MCLKVVFGWNIYFLFLVSFVPILGEVISVEEAMKRVKTTEKVENFYIITVDNRTCIDAREMGSVARFINHR